MSKTVKLSSLVLLTIFFVLTFLENDYLFRVQELNLFLYTPLFFKQQLVVAGGLLTYLGTYFTQFFYYVWLGALLLCVWLGVLIWLTHKAFKVSDEWAVLLLIPVALILLTDFDLGYWLYYLKLRGHFFITVIGMSLVVSLVWLYRLIPAGRWLHLCLVVVVALVGYPLAGFYGLLALLLMAVITWRRADLTLTMKAVTSIAAIALMLIVPLIYYRQLYYQTNVDFIWFQALPLYPGGEGFSAYFLPYLFLGLFYLLLSAFYGMDFDLKFLRSRWKKLAMQALISIVAVWGCWHFWFRDEAFRTEIRMDTYCEQQDWEGVLTEMRNYEGEPTRMMVMYKNLALFKLGRAGNEMYTYRDGSKPLNISFEVRMAQIGGKRLYLNYGLPNYCYRWCLEDGVEYGWRAEYLKYLVRCSLLNQEWNVAQKYIDILKETRFHHEWAERYEQFAKQKSEKALLDDKEFGPIFRLLYSSTNILGSDQSLVELFMLNMLAYRTTDDPQTSELVLLSAIQLKDIPAFWPAFFQYAQLHNGQPMPRHYQEAAFLYGNLEHKVDISHMPFDESVKRDYVEMMEMAKRCQGMSDEQMKEAFYPRFGKTFYYNYFLIRGMKTY
jgi:membrane protein YdbS with pleckstrin-like domain